MDRISPEILSVVFKDKRLCTRYGTYVGVCPENELSVGSEFYPELDLSCCTSCGLCDRACPGERVSFKKLAALTFSVNNHDPTFDGHVTNTYVRSATDTTFRSGGAGGGVPVLRRDEYVKHNKFRGYLSDDTFQEVPAVWG